MIEIKNLKISVEDKEILKWIDITLSLWSNYLILWKNGSWKSSLSHFLMWNPVYKYKEWEIFIDWKNLLELNISERAQQWLFLAFQNVPEIPWVNISEYLRMIYNNMLKQQSPETKPLSPFVFQRFIKKFLTELSIDEKFLQRDLNVWFSWWEKRKLELLQLKLLNPKYIILDEIDSWLDIDAFKVVANSIASQSSPEKSIIIITHHFTITEFLDINTIYVLKDGVITKSGGPELLEEIKTHWFE